MEAAAMTQDSAHYRFGVLCVIVSAVAWSTAGFFTRLIPLDAWTILFWRGIFAGASIVAYTVWQYRGETWRVYRSMSWPGWLFALCSTIGMTVFISALKLTTVAEVSIIYATVPFVTAALAWIWLRERATAATWAASVLAFAGVVVTLSGASFGANLWGDLLAFAMTAAVAVMMVISRRHRDIPMVPAAALSTLLGAIISLPWAAPAAAGPMDLAYLTLFGCCQMTLGLTLFAIGARLIPAAHTALIGALETALAPLWVWIAFSERPPPLVLLGGAVVMLAVIGHVLIENRRSTAENARIAAAAPGAECH
jgi:drug/metabolite transporter (DMT)-like permease